MDVLIKMKPAIFRLNDEEDLIGIEGEKSIDAFLVIFFSYRKDLMTRLNHDEMNYTGKTLSARLFFSASIYPISHKKKNKLSFTFV